VIQWRDEVLGSGSISATTFSKVNRAALNVVFAKGVDLLKLAENPFSGLKVAKDKRPILRDKSFSAGEAKAILAASLRAPNAPGRRGAILRTALRWVPWICAYTGARVGEITQLRKEDVIEDDGVWCIRITPEAGAVKNKEARIVPLHPHLIQQGFLVFIDEANPGPLFYSAEAKAAQPWEVISGRIGEWVRKDVGITDRAIRPNHAWRHRFRTVCDDVGIEQKYVNAICGHAPGSEGERYGERSARALLREIERVPWYRV
jgi:integrase